MYFFNLIISFKAIRGYAMNLVRLSAVSVTLLCLTPWYQDAGEISTGRFITKIENYDIYFQNLQLVLGIWIQRIHIILLDPDP